MKAVFGSRFLATLSLWLIASATQAGANLDPGQSSIHFVSTKNSTVAEVHHFREISGSLDDSGRVEVLIALDAVETLIPIRNERMRELLFQTANYPTATLTAQVSIGEIAALKAGERMTLDLAVTLDLHGKSRELQAAVMVTRLEGGVAVSTLAPLVVNAQDFDLVPGIEALRDVAKLTSISVAVPVSARLVFAL